MHTGLRDAAMRVAAVVAVLSVSAACAQDQLPGRRDGDPPVITGTPVIPPGSTGAVTAPAKPRSAAQESLLDVILQVEQLQNEVRILRDSVEVQKHEIDQLKSRNRDLIEDLDRRVRALEQRGAEAPAGEPGTVPAPKAISAEHQIEYDAAFDLMKQGMYDRAVKAFREFNAKHPNNGLADNAQYWIAEGTYVQRQYKQSLDEFNRVLTAYPQSQKVPDAMLKIGYVHYELGAFDKARKTLNEVQSRYPNTTVAKLAAARLDKMKKEGR